MAVIALADECGSDGVERSGADAAGALIEVSGVLVKDRLHDDVANDGGTDAVGV